MLLICSEPGSCLSAEIPHINVLDSRAAGLAVDISVASNLLTVTSRYILLPKRSLTCTPWLQMTVYPEMINEKESGGVFVLCSGHWIQSEGSASICLIHKVQRQPNDQSGEQWALRLQPEFWTIPRICSPSADKGTSGRTGSWRVKCVFYW